MNDVKHPTEYKLPPPSGDITLHKPASRLLALVFYSCCVLMLAAFTFIIATQIWGPSPEEMEQDRKEHYEEILPDNCNLGDPIRINSSGAIEYEVVCHEK